MFKIEYNVKIDDETGDPYIDIPVDYEQRQEDKFFAFEITRYVLQDILKKGTYNSNPILLKAIQDNFDFISDISDELGSLIVDQMKIAGEISMSFDVNYNFKVDTYNDLLYKNMYHYKDKLFMKVQGLTVYVNDTNDIYVYDLDETDTLAWIKIVGA